MRASKWAKKAGLAAMGLLAGLYGGGAVEAAEVRSEYTSLDLNTCLLLKADDFEVEFACPGYKGYPVRVVEADLRFYVSFGFGAHAEMAAHQTLAPFNRINDTLEWRMRNEEGRFLPFATILRWYTEDLPDAPGAQFLVITQLAPDNSCHIGYVNASSVQNANEKAREIADQSGGKFECGRDEPIRVPAQD